MFDQQCHIFRWELHVKKHYRWISIPAPRWRPTAQKTIHSMRASFPACIGAQLELNLKCIILGELCQRTRNYLWGDLSKFMRVWEILSSTLKHIIPNIHVFKWCFFPLPIFFFLKLQNRCEDLLKTACVLIEKVSTSDDVILMNDKINVKK